MQPLQFAILGIGTGAVYALLGQSIVAVNRGANVLNFACGAVGMFCAYVFYRVRDGWHLPGAGAALVALAVAAVGGAVVHRFIMSRLAAAPTTARIMATLAIMTAILQAVLMTWGSNPYQIVASPFPSSSVSIGGSIKVGLDVLLLGALGIGVTIALVVGQRKTRLGLATSAVSENRVVAASMGWSPDVVGAVCWAVGSMLATIGSIMAASLTGLNPTTLTLLVVPAMAAALVGRFESFTWTLVGGMAIGIAESEIGRYVRSPGWAVAAPLFAIVIILAIRGTYLPGRGEASERRPSVGRGRIHPVLIGFVVAALVAIVAAPVTWEDPIATTLLVALLVLSLVVCTGYAGQLSLAQVAIAGVGAYGAAELSVEVGISPLLAVLLAALGCSAASLVIALPAIRTRGPNLAIATLSLAVAIDSLIISNPNRFKIAGRNLHRLSVFGYDISAVQHPQRFGIAMLVVFVLAALAVRNLRRSQSGRRMLAVRSNERAAAALGISVRGVKLHAFWISSLLAALAGGLMEVRFQNADLSSFPVVNNITTLLYGMIGGIGWIAGSVIGGVGSPGGLSNKILDVFTQNGGNWLILAGAIGALMVVLQSPDGVAPLTRRQLADVFRLVRRLGGHLGQEMDRSSERLPAAPVAVTRTPHTVDRAPSMSLAVENLTVVFGQQRALDDVSLRLDSGEVLGLIGANGAGKSTLIDVVTGFQKQHSGTVVLGGQPLDRLGPVRRAQMGLARTFQNLELFEDLTVEENLFSAAERYAAERAIVDLFWPRRPRLDDIVNASIEELGLHGILHLLPRELDYARRHLVSIARAISMRPSLLLLDEPAAGLDAQEREDLCGLLVRIARDWGIGVLLVEHDVGLVFSVCDRVVVLDRGHVIAVGSPDMVRSDPAVVGSYLGDSIDVERGLPAETASVPSNGAGVSRHA